MSAPHVWIPKDVRPDVYNRTRLTCPIEGCPWFKPMVVRADHERFNRECMDAMNEHLIHDHRNEVVNRDYIPRRFRG